MRKDILEDAKRWLIHAWDEFNDACDLKERKRYYLALFHFQQSAEKALKAYFYQLTSSQEVFFTHSIYELIDALCKYDDEFKKIRVATKLDEYYIPTRYPNGLPGGIPSRFFKDEKEADEAMELAKMVIDMIKRKMNIVDLK
jgi:HEPN domain-containing protein